MQIVINVKKSHLYGFLIGMTVILGAFMVTAFGGSTPTVLGHSAGELIVNSTSIVDGSIIGADITSNTLGATQIDSTSLAGECSSITGGASLCDGSDQDTDTDQQQLGTSGSSITLTNSGSVIAPDLSCTACIGGTEIDESTLGTVPTASALGFASVGSTDVCVDEGSVAYCTAGSCGDGTCDGCGAKVPQDLVWHFSSGRLIGTSQLGVGAC